VGADEAGRRQRAHNVASGHEPADDAPLDVRAGHHTAGDPADHDGGNLVDADDDAPHDDEHRACDHDPADEHLDPHHDRRADDADDHRDPDDVDRHRGHDDRAGDDDHDRDRDHNHGTVSLGRRRLLAPCALVLALATACGSHHSGSGSGFVVGAVEDAAQFGNAHQQMQLAADSGLRAIDLSAIWQRGEDTVPAAQLAGLRRAVSAARAAGIRPILSVYQLSGNTPISDTDRASFASFASSLARALPAVRDVIVGNEPNLDLFWRPQFGPAGEDVAATAFEAVLAQTYDALKSVDADLDVIGVGVAPRGSDHPSATRETHSPTQFLLDLGRAYRASGRTKPIMDALSLHPYGETPKIPPTFTHPRSTSIGIADYGKLVDLLGRAFGGTAQPGRKLPIVYGEYGAETTIPPMEMHLYTGHEVVPTVDEATQASYYVEAIRLAACQPTVRMLLFFHVVDESKLAGLQTGVRYADGSPKASLKPVREAALAADQHGCSKAS
jgi:hypothetical protein